MIGLMADYRLLEVENERIYCYSGDFRRAGFLGLAVKLAFFGLRVIFGLAFVGLIVFAIIWLLSKVLLLF